LHEAQQHSVFFRELIRSEHGGLGQIDVLINNAGTMVRHGQPAMLGTLALNARSIRPPPDSTADATQGVVIHSETQSPDRASARLSELGTLAPA
jgi:hypothetical protein